MLWQSHEARAAHRASSVACQVKVATSLGATGMTDNVAVSRDPRLQVAGLKPLLQVVTLLRMGRDYRPWTGICAGALCFPVARSSEASAAAPRGESSELATGTEAQVGQGCEVSPWTRPPQHSSLAASTRVHASATHRRFRHTQQNMIPSRNLALKSLLVALIT